MRGAALLLPLLLAGCSVGRPPEGPFAPGRYALAPGQRADVVPELKYCDSSTRLPSTQSYFLVCGVVSGLGMRRMAATSISVSWSHQVLNSSASR